MKGLTNTKSFIFLEDITKFVILKNFPVIIHTPKLNIERIQIDYYKYTDTQIWQLDSPYRPFRDEDRL